MNSVHMCKYGHLGANQKDPDYQGVLSFQVNLYTKELLWDLN